MENAKDSILTFDEKVAENVDRDALKEGLDLSEFIEKGVLEGMKAVGDIFEEGNACLLHIFAASNTMKAGLAVFEVSGSCKKVKENMAIELVQVGQQDEKLDVLETMFKINGYEVVEIPDDFL